MVVLDAIHQIQANQANDLAVRWNCKAGKCGSCSAEVNGNPRLMCMTRLNQLDLSEPVTVEPMRSFPAIRDLVTDVSWNFRAKLTVKPFLASAAGCAGRNVADVSGRRRTGAGISQVHRVFSLPGRVPRPARSSFVRSVRRTAPLRLRGRSRDAPARRATIASKELKAAHGIGYCNITKCCTKVCPENITITDNAIIPLKERVIDRLYDPVVKLLRMFRMYCNDSP